MVLTVPTKSFPIKKYPPHGTMNSHIRPLIVPLVSPTPLLHGITSHILIKYVHYPGTVVIANHCHYPAASDVVVLLRLWLIANDHVHILYRVEWTRTRRRMFNDGKEHCFVVLKLWISLHSAEYLWTVQEQEIVQKYREQKVSTERLWRDVGIKWIFLLFRVANYYKYAHQFAQWRWSSRAGGTGWLHTK